MRRAQHRKIAVMLPSMSPEARLAVIDGAGHMGPLTHGAMVSALIAAHICAAEAMIRQLSGGRSRSAAIAGRDAFLPLAGAAVDRRGAIGRRNPRCRSPGAAAGQRFAAGILAQSFGRGAHLSFHGQAQRSGKDLLADNERASVSRQPSGKYVFVA
jgi:hypothetical protein